ncbi:MAG: beta-ketoacyl-[acyl-carrier-protein] synthase family protein [Verrucomicrobiota bacterium]
MNDRSPVVPRRVVVTGLGLATALGFEPGEFWARLLSGESGIRRLPWLTDDSPQPVKFAGWIDDPALAAAGARLGIDEAERGDQLAVTVVGTALEDAGWPTDRSRALPHDLILGTGHGTVGVTNEATRNFLEGGYRRMRPTTVVRSMFNRPANLGSIRFRLTGSSYVVSCACATGAIAFGEAYQRVRLGLADAAVAACADSGLDVTTFSAWNRLGVLARHADPARACRPFDRDRTGFVLGEGAAGFVLEPLETAQARGARIRAEVVGYGSTSDAHHLVQPDADGQVRAIRRALAGAGVGPEAVGYINAHGTATELADLAEAQALGTVLGERAGSLPLSNNKAQLGHLMGATAGVELASTVLALERGCFPPCRNLDDPDPRCPLGFIRGEPLHAPVEYALKNSFAFGGTNAAILLRRWSP